MPISIADGVLTILQGRLSKLLSGTDTKAIQKIVISLGHISVNETSFPHLKVALDLIFGLCRSKVSDLSEFLFTRNFIDLYALITQTFRLRIYFLLLVRLYLSYGVESL